MLWSVCRNVGPLDQLAPSSLEYTVLRPHDIIAGFEFAIRLLTHPSLVPTVDNVQSVRVLGIQWEDFITQFPDHTSRVYYPEGWCRCHRISKWNRMHLCYWRTRLPDSLALRAHVVSLRNPIMVTYSNQLLPVSLFSITFENYNTY